MSAGVALDQYPTHGGSKIRGNDHHGSRMDNEKFKQMRSKADAEYEKKTDCMERAHDAYERGDGAGAKQLSNAGKAHAAEGDRLNKEAGQAIFDDLNAGLDPHIIDLHGLYVHEAVDFTTKRIQREQSSGSTYLHVIVGQGHHSIDHKQRIKPAIEELCENLGLKYRIEENAGRIYVNLQGGDVTHIPPPPPPQHDGYQHHPQNHHGDQQQHHSGQQHQHHGGQTQDEEQYDEVEKFLKKLINKYCCAVM